MTTVPQIAGKKPPSIPASLGSPNKNSGETVDPKLVGKLFIAK
jgi:hypothetical protein